MADSFKFRRFSVKNEDSALKVGTDAVLLGASLTLLPSDRMLLDIGTGTGVIALMAAQRLEEASADFFIDAIDIDGASAEEAGFNFSASPWKDRLRSYHCPLAGYRPVSGFDCIFSNPPYYDNSLKNPDERESAARHTETLSYRDICAFASEKLLPEGRLSLILPAEPEKNLVRTAASFGLYPFRTVRIRTTPAKPVRRIIIEFSRRRKEIAEESLTLQEGPNRTDAYRELTSDFYIN